MPTPSASCPPARAAHFYWIDWLRFLAAFLVLIDHACKANWAGLEGNIEPGLPVWTRWALLPTRLGQEAVVVFFVLSGALVGGLTLEKVRAGTFDVRAYAADRFARVYVPLVPALLLSVAVLRAFDQPAMPGRFVGCLFGLQGVAVRAPAVNGVLWTLAYEVWFYVLAGCAGALAAWPCRSRTVRGAAAAGVALSLWALCVRLDGVYLACWLLGAAGFGWRHRLRRVARAGAGLAMMVAGIVGARAGLLPSLGSAPWRVGAAHLVLAAGTLLLVLGACRSAPRTRAGTRLERTGTALAAFSYTLYLVHFPLLVVLRTCLGPLPMGTTDGPAVLRALAWTALCVAVALAMYAIFERQTPRVRRWLRTRLGEAAAPRPVPAGQGTLVAGV